MLRWLFSKKPSQAGIPELRAEFAQMLEAAHKELSLSSGAFLRLNEAESVKEEVLALDKQINKAERRIRRELFLKAVVNGESYLSFCLTLMSAVKDAERLGDYAKNFYDLAVQADAPADGMRDQMCALRDELLAQTLKCKEVFLNEDEEGAKELIFKCTELADDCEEQILWYLKKTQPPTPLDVVYVLALRYFKRYASHLRNITSTVVQPLHKIDFTGKIVKRYREENQ